MGGSALAQDLPIDAAPELNSQLYRHSVDSEGTLWSDTSGGVADEPVATFRFATNYVHKPFLVEWSDRTESVLVRQAWQVDLMGAVQVDRYRFGLRLPGYLSSGGDLSQGGAGLSDIGIDLRATALDRTEAPVGLAFGFRTSFPTSTVDVPVGSTLEWELFGVVDQQVGDILLTGNLAYRGVPRAELLNVVWGDQLALRGGGAYSVLEDTLVSLELATSTSIPNWSVFNRETSQGAAVPAELLLGATQTVASDWRVSAGLGKGLTNGIGSPLYRLVAAVEFRPALSTNPDLDGDGILNVADQCPEEAEDFDGLYDEDGCPDPQSQVFVTVVDPSGEPIYDAQLITVGWEGSPRVNRPWTTMPGAYAIKAVAPGYEDALTTIEARGDVGKQKFTITMQPVATKGTLVVTVRMEDGTPFEGSTIQIGEEHLVGPEVTLELPAGEVPVVIQAGEGFQKIERTAAITAESATNLDVTLAPVRVVIKEDRFDLRESVFFETGKAVIKDVSYSLLDEVAQALKDHAEITLIRIEGHTDDRGSASYNKKLSQQRADAVRGYLIRRGVDGERLESVGFGEERPLDDRQVEEAWEKNRRVDFFVVERSD